MKGVTITLILFSACSVCIGSDIAEQKVLLINVHGPRYNLDSENLFQTLIQSGAIADYVNLEANGEASKLIQTNQYEQIWLFDLSINEEDDYPTDWLSIANWFNNKIHKNIICDARMLASYRYDHFLDEGKNLTENYYYNLLIRGGGLVLATDHEEYHYGINEVNKLIGLMPFSGWYDPQGTWEIIPVDTKNPLMQIPNNIGESLIDDSSPGKSPYGLQPNGLNLYSVAWHSGDVDTPGISSTIEGDVGFHLKIVSPSNNDQFFLGDSIHFQVEQSGGSSPITYIWVSDKNGIFANQTKFDFTELDLGIHTIKVIGKDLEGLVDDDQISITILSEPTISITPTNTNTPKDTLRPTFTPTPTYTFTPTKTLVPIVESTNTPIITPTLISPSPTFTPTMTPIISFLCTNDFSLHQHQIYTFDTTPLGLIVDDFNHDGNDDILTALPSKKELILFLLQENKQNLFEEIHLPIDFEPEFISCGDFNGDGLTDVVLLSYVDYRLSVLFNDSVFSFKQRQSVETEFYDIQSLNSLRNIRPLICFDLDEDNLDELIFIQPDPALFFSSIRLYKFDNDGNIKSKRNIKLNDFLNQDIQAIDLMNIDSDESFELVVYTSQNPSVFLFKPLTETEYKKWQNFSLENVLSGNQMAAFSKNDANKDSIDDLIFAQFDGTIRYLRLEGSLIQESTIGDLGVNSIHDDLIIIDLDLDGQKDILIASRQKSGADSYEELSVVCGDNIGEFKEVVTFASDRKSGLESLILDTIDFDCDGVEDIAFLDSFNKQLVLFKNVSSVPTLTPTPEEMNVDEWTIH